MGTHRDTPIWNLFRRREEGELWCAVPADAAVPRFLFSGEWDYGGQHADRRHLPGFRHAVAHQSVRMNGFYVFQALRMAV